MKLVICCMKDELQGFLVPQFHNSQKFLERGFREALNTVPEMKLHARDLSYYYLGEYDMETGTIISSLPKKLLDGAACVKGDVVND